MPSGFFFSGKFISKSTAMLQQIEKELVALPEISFYIKPSVSRSQLLLPVA